VNVVRNFEFRNRQRIPLSAERHVFQEQFSSTAFIINSSVHTFTVAIDVLIVQSQLVLHSTCNRMPDWVALPHSRMLRIMPTLQRTYSGRNCTAYTPPWSFPLGNWKPYLHTAQTTMRNMQRGRPGKMQNICMLVKRSLYKCNNNTVNKVVWDQLPRGMLGFPSQLIRLSRAQTHIRDILSRGKNGLSFTLCLLPCAQQPATGP